MGEGTGVLERKERVALSYVRQRYLIGCHRVNLMPVRIGVLMLFEFSDFRSQVTPQAQNIEIVGTEYAATICGRPLASCLGCAPLMPIQQPNARSRSGWSAAWSRMMRFYFSFSFMNRCLQQFLMGLCRSKFYRELAGRCSASCLYPLRTSFIMAAYSPSRKRTRKSHRPKAPSSPGKTSVLSLNE